MTVPSVTYTGEEVALIAGFIALAMPRLDSDTHSVADLLLDRALAAFPDPMSPDSASRIAQLRERAP